MAHCDKWQGVKKFMEEGYLRRKAYIGVQIRMASLKRRYLGCTGIRLQKREAGVGVDTADRSSSMQRHRGRRDTSHLRDIIVIGNGEFGAGRER